MGLVVGLVVCSSSMKNMVTFDVILLRKKGAQGAPMPQAGKPLILAVSTSSHTVG